MMPLNHLLEARLSHMGVDLGGGDIGVPEQHLHRTQIGAMVEQMGRKGMAQPMGGQGKAEARSGGIALD